MAEDLTQQLFLKQWTYQIAHPHFIPQNWRAWLFKGAINLKNDTIRWMRYLPSFYNLEDSSFSSSICIDDTKEHLQKLTVRKALFQLKERERDLLLLKYMGFDSEEIGKMLHISASAVRSRTATAKKHFEKLLQTLESDR